MTVYGSDLKGINDDVFRFLASKGEDVAAELFLRQRINSIGYHHRRILMETAINASAQLFTSTLDLLRSDKKVDNDLILTTLCKEVKLIQDRGLKVAVVLDAVIDPNAVKEHLVSCWVRGLKDRWDASEDSGGAIGQLIIERNIDKVSDQWLGLAMALCCSPLNLELLGILIDRNLAKIQSDPSCLEHILLECCSAGDIDTFSFILARCGSCIYGKALEFWCEAGDLEAVTILLEVEAGSAELTACIPTNLVLACTQGDAELAELIIRFAGDSISRSEIMSAFQMACYRSHGEVIKALAEIHPFNSDFRINSDYDLYLKSVDPEIVSLLNEVFDTELEPVPEGKAMPFVENDVGHSIRYGRESIIYRLRPARKL